MPPAYHMEVGSSPRLSESKKNATQQGGVSLWSAFGLLCRLPACGGLIQKQGKSGKVFPCKQFVPYGEWKRLHFFCQRLTNRTTARPGGSFAWSVLAYCMEKRARSGGVSACWKSSLSLPSLFSEFGGHTGNVDAQNGAGFHRHHRRGDMQTAHPTSPCAGVNRRLAMSSRASRLAPLSALRLYTSPGATSNQVIFPAPLSS